MSSPLLELGDEEFVVEPRMTFSLKSFFNCLAFDLS
jgi:hypothetical protein